MIEYGRGLDIVHPATDNKHMVIPGRVVGGVVVLEGEPILPEGATVIVSYEGPAGRAPAVEKKRIQVPLVRTGQPASVHLTGDRIAEILDEEDVSPRR
jgi:hypothetical protein